MISTKFHHYIVIVGAGLSGLREAIECVEEADIAIVSKVLPTRSHSGAAQERMISPTIRDTRYPKDRILDSLNRIRSQKDPTLSFRMSCGHGQDRLAG